MVKLTAIMILKYMGPDKDPLLLGSATDLSSFGFFQRSTVREMLVFVSRTVARKTVVGTRQSVQHQEYFAHAYNRDGLVAVVFADADYPARAGFCAATAVLDEFVAQQGQAWRGASADEEAANPVLETALQKFQVGWRERDGGGRSSRRLLWRHDRGGYYGVPAGRSKIRSVLFIYWSVLAQAMVLSNTGCAHANLWSCLPSANRIRRRPTSSPRSSGIWMRPRSFCTRR